MLAATTFILLKLSQNLICLFSGEHLKQQILEMSVPHIKYLRKHLRKKGVIESVQPKQQNIQEKYQHGSFFWNSERVF